MGVSLPDLKILDGWCDLSLCDHSNAVADPDYIVRGWGGGGGVNKRKGSENVILTNGGGRGEGRAGGIRPPLKGSV